MGAPRAAMSAESEIGTLVVVVLKARNLRDRHTFYKQDAYAQVQLHKETKKTQVDVKGGQHPVWDEELRFPVVKRASDETRKLEVSCWSKEPRTDECVGRGTVDITETLKTGEFDDWVPLKMEDGAYRGELYLEMTYYAKTPPLQRRASKWKPSERLTRPASAYAYPEVPPVPTTAPGASPASHGIPPTVVESSELEDELPLPGYPQYSQSHATQGQHAPAAAHRSPVHKQDELPPLPEEADAAPAPVPASLLPGGGRPRVNSHTSPKASHNVLPPQQSIHAHAPVPPRDPSPPAQAPFESIPPYLRPAGSHTPIPEPQIPPPQAYAPPPLSYAPPPQTYNPPSQPYPPSTQAYSPPPQSSYAPPPQTYAPQQQPYPPAQAYASAAGPYGSPPRHYAVPSAPTYIPPRGPPAPQGYPPYGYPPPPRTQDDDLPDPFLQARYQTPLPLPDDGISAPAQAAPRRSPPPRHPQTQNPPPKKETQTHSRGPSREERDRLLALQLEKEEEERQRALREQEERDNELARQLDLELNLEAERAAAETAGGGGETGRVPGAW